MLRTIGAVVLGYLAMALVVFVALSGAYLAVGADGAFRPGVYEVSALWIGISLVVGFGAALLGGVVARKVAGGARGPRVLAAVVFVLGLATAAPALRGDAGAAAPRTGEVGNIEAMQSARTPLVVLLLNPLIGAAGVLVGGRALRTERAAEAEAPVVAGG